MAAADLAVADDRAAEALAEVAGRRSRAVRACSARAAQLTSLSTVTGPSTTPARTAARVERADQERRVGQLDEPAGLAVHGVGGADDGEPVRAVAAASSRSVCADVRARAPRRGPRRRRRRRSSRRRCPRGRCSATSAWPGRGGEGVVGADAAAAGRALAGVHDRAGLLEAPDALRDRRLREARRGGDLRARGAPLRPSARAARARRRASAAAPASAWPAPRETF